MPDNIEFGLQPGGELPIQATFCFDIRENHAPVVIHHVSADARYREHQASKSVELKVFFSEEKKQKTFMSLSRTYPAARQDANVFGSFFQKNNCFLLLLEPALLESKHFYEPSAGHGLKHDPFNAIVGPRPIGWISTKGANGTLNLAPYSFFNAFNYKPPIIGFSSNGAKDTLRNARESGEFVWNLATRPVAEQMNATSAAVPYGSDEFTLAGLTPVPSRLVAAPRVAESPVHFECKVSDIVQLKGYQGNLANSWLIIGEVIAVHIANTLLKDGIFDTFGAQIILRSGGPSAYAAIGPETRFDMVRPA